MNEIEIATYVENMIVPIRVESEHRKRFIFKMAALLGGISMANEFDEKLKKEIDRMLGKAEELVGTSAYVEDEKDLDRCPTCGKDF